MVVAQAATPLPLAEGPRILGVGACGGDQEYKIRFKKQDFTMVLNILGVVELMKIK